MHAQLHTIRIIFSNASVWVCLVSVERDVAFPHCNHVVNGIYSTTCLGQKEIELHCDILTFLVVSAAQKSILQLS